MTARVLEELKFPGGKGCQGQLDTRHPIRSSPWIETRHLPSPRTLRSLRLLGRCYQSSALKHERPCPWTAGVVCHGNIGSRKGHLECLCAVVPEAQHESLTCRQPASWCPVNTLLIIGCQRAAPRLGLNQEGGQGTFFF